MMFVLNGRDEVVVVVVVGNALEVVVDDVVVVELEVVAQSKCHVNLVRQSYWSQPTSCNYQCNSNALGTTSTSKEAILEAESASCGYKKRVAEGASSSSKVTISSSTACSCSERLRSPSSSANSDVVRYACSTSKTTCAQAELEGCWASS